MGAGPPLPADTALGWHPSVCFFSARPTLNRAQTPAQEPVKALPWVWKWHPLPLIRGFTVERDQWGQVAASRASAPRPDPPVYPQPLCCMCTASWGLRVPGLGRPDQGQ